MTHAHRSSLVIGSALAAAFSGLALPSAAAPPGTVLVSGPSSDPTAVTPNVFPSISRFGGRVAFQSFEDGLVPGDANGVSDILVRNLRTGQLVRASVDRWGGDSNGASTTPSLSPDGRYVAFASDASDLVRHDGNGVNDIFLRDLKEKRTIRLSAGIAAGDPTRRVASPSVSSDGRRVVFQVATGSSVASGAVYVWRLASGRSRLVSSASFLPSISADGRFVAFVSDATDLVPGDDNGVTDVFRRNLETGRTVLVSRDRFGGGADATALPGAPALSEHGRFVVFHSDASDLVANDTNGEPDVFRRNVARGRTVRVSLTSDEEEVTGFGSFHQVRMGISGDGRLVVFSSDASGLTPNDANGQPDSFLRDVAGGTTTLLSVDLSGHSGDGFSIFPAISLDGRFAVFSSEANDITADDVDDLVDDVFRRPISWSTAWTGSARG